jgi:hypothetical protein
MACVGFPATGFLETVVAVPAAVAPRSEGVDGERGGGHMSATNSLCWENTRAKR